MSVGRSVVVGLALIASSVWIAIWKGGLVIPEKWAPWMPLRIEAEPGLLTRYKLSRLSNDAGRCDEVLATAMIAYERLTDRTTGPGCGFTTPSASIGRQRKWTSRSR